MKSSIVLAFAFALLGVASPVDTANTMARRGDYHHRHARHGGGKNQFVPCVRTEDGTEHCNWKGKDWKEWKGKKGEHVPGGPGPEVPGGKRPQDDDEEEATVSILPVDLPGATPSAVPEVVPEGTTEGNGEEETEEDTEVKPEEKPKKETKGTDKESLAINAKTESKQKGKTEEEEVTAPNGCGAGSPTKEKPPKGNKETKPESNQEESNQEESNQEESNQEESNQEESNQEESNQEEEEVVDGNGEGNSEESASATAPVPSQTAAAGAGNGNDGPPEAIQTPDAQQEEQDATVQQPQRRQHNLRGLHFLA